MCKLLYHSEVSKIRNSFEHNQKLIMFEYIRCGIIANNDLFNTCIKRANLWNVSYSATSNVNHAWGVLRFIYSPNLRSMRWGVYQEMDSNSLTNQIPNSNGTAGQREKLYCACAIPRVIKSTKYQVIYMLHHLNFVCLSCFFREWVNETWN